MRNDVLGQIILLSGRVFNVFLRQFNWSRWNGSEHIKARAALKVLRLVHETTHKCHEVSNLHAENDACDLFERCPVANLLSIKRSHVLIVADRGVARRLNEHEDAQRDRETDSDESEEAGAAAVDHVEVVQVLHAPLSEKERHIDDGGKQLGGSSTREVNDLELPVLPRHRKIIAG